MKDSNKILKWAQESNADSVTTIKRLLKERKEIEKKAEGVNINLVNISLDDWEG